MLQACRFKWYNISLTFCNACNKYMHYFLINSNVIAEIGFAEFKQNIICSWVTGLGHTKKAPKGA